MIVTNSYANDIQEIRDLYNTAEADLKTVGRIQDALIVTGVNQCRCQTGNETDGFICTNPS